MIFGFGLPEGACLADLGHDFAEPETRGVGDGDHLLDDLALPVARVEDLGAVVAADEPCVKAGRVDL
jgi:hypothetical protein